LEIRVLSCISQEKSMVDRGMDFYCKLSRYSKENVLWTGRATWEPTGVRVPGGLRRGKLAWGRRPHPAFYHGRRVHVAYYRKLIARRLMPYGKLVWSECYPANLHTIVGKWSEWLDPLGTWTWGGLYEYQVPYAEAMWNKWVRKREMETTREGVNSSMPSALLRIC